MQICSPLFDRDVGSNIFYLSRYVIQKVCKSLNWYKGQRQLSETVNLIKSHEIIGKEKRNNELLVFN